MSFLSGEPLPPGFEDDDVSARAAIVLKQIESYNSAPLLGTEYTVELREPGQPRPEYYCVLCQTCNDSRSIFVHWTSQVHRAKYLQTHFLKAHDLLQKLKRTPNGAQILVQATSLLVKLIEKHHGRSQQLLSVGGDEFRRFRAKICCQVRDYFHFDECAGPDFVAEAQRLLQDLKPDEAIKINLKITEADLKREGGNAIALDAISSDDEPFGTIQDSSKKQQCKKSLAEDQSANGRGANRSPPPPGGLPKALGLPTPKELSIQASHIAQERYKWEKFRCMLELQLKRLRDDTDTYESNPEKHPNYPDEWKKFWNRRYKQLQEEKKCDPNLYDYKPEWINYWKDRRVELFNIAVNKIKKELMDKFKLSDEDEEKTKELMEAYKIRVASPREASAPPAKAANRRKPNFRNNKRSANAKGGEDGPGAEAVIDISDDETSNSPNHYRRASYQRSPSRSLSQKEAAGGRRPFRRSHSRSARRNYRRGSRTRSRSSSRDARSRRSSSRGYYHRQHRDRYPSSRERGDSPHSNRDYGDRRSLDRERSSGGGGEYYRAGSYGRPNRYDRVETFRVMDSRVYPEYSQGFSKIRSISPGMSSNSKSNSKEKPLEALEEGPLTVVSVLRMLSAVEEHLGSLGPKALNLLSKALAMEMVQPNSADDLLLNEDNCVFMETTKEKLKGILIAEVLDDPQKVRVVKKVITSIAAIIFQVTNQGMIDSKQAQLKANANPAKIQLPFERHLVAPKLANALVLKGYYDVSTEDMNKLLHLYTLMMKTHHQRRAEDKNNSLSFGEVCNKLGLSSTVAAATPEPENIDIDLDELMKEVEHQLHKESLDVAAAAAAASASAASSTPEKPNEPGGAMESLTDSDLQTLLQNFKFLSNEEQVHLIGHLRKLEVLEPARVQRLRKYVNLAELSADGESCSDFLARVVNKTGGMKSKPAEKSAMGLTKATVAGSQTSNALKATTISGLSVDLLPALITRRSSERDPNNVPINKQRRMRNSPAFRIDDDDDDDEDDDYNFDDLVMKACDSNGGGMGKKVAGAAAFVPAKASVSALTFKPAAASTKLSIKDTESIIADLMGTLSKGGAGGSNSGLSGSAGNRSSLMQQQQNLPPAASNPSKPNTNRNRAASGAYPNPGYSGVPAPQQQHTPAPQPRQILSNVSGGPDPNPQYPYGAAGGYHPYPGNGGHNYPAGAAPGHGAYGGGGPGGGQLNPWANNGPPQPPFNPLPQNFLNQQQQPHPPHYNNIFGGRH